MISRCAAESGRSLQAGYGDAIISKKRTFEVNGWEEKTMTTQRILIMLALVAGLANALCAQKVPVRIFEGAQDDPESRFRQSLADEIQLSGKFFLLDPRTVLPPNGVFITITALPIKSPHGDMGIALYADARIESTKDPGYFRHVGGNLYVIPESQPLADYTRAFLAQVDRGIGN
jgi:hypothetical protein